MTDQFRTLMAYVFGITAFMMIWYLYSMPQPFPIPEGFMNQRGQCGPNFGVCPDGLRCLNGYCKTDVAPKLPPLSDLPIRPDRYVYPVPAPSVNVSGIMNCKMVD